MEEEILEAENLLFYKNKNKKLEIKKMKVK